MTFLNSLGGEGEGGSDFFEKLVGGSDLAYNAGIGPRDYFSDISLCSTLWFS